MIIQSQLVLSQFINPAKPVALPKAAGRFEATVTSGAVSDAAVGSGSEGVEGATVVGEELSAAKIV